MTRKPWSESRRVAVFLALLAVAAVGGETVQKEVVFQEMEVFPGRTGGYDNYRIPAVVTSNQGTLLAFCEGRHPARSDSWNIDVMMRRSTDGGKSWSNLQALWDDGGNWCGNPGTVVDRETGTIWLLMTWSRGDDGEAAIVKGTSKDTCHVFACSSKDDGVTWSKPAEITKTAKDPDWRWYATGPGAGIQVTHGRHKGRLIIPCDHSAPHGGYESHIIYSDDHGGTWKTGGTIPNFTECEVVERTDGTLLINMRNFDERRKTRGTATSADGGETWSKVTHDQTLIEPNCQGSVRRYTTVAKDGKSRVLFSNPASTSQRVRMTVRLSYDEGRTWPVAKLINAGGSGYSCLTVLPDRTIGLLYEKQATRGITFARFTLDWLTDGKDALEKPGARAGGPASKAGAEPLDYTIDRTTARKGLDGKRCFCHPRAGVIPPRAPGNPSETPMVVITFAPHSLPPAYDVFYATNHMRSDDLGRTWDGPREHPATMGRRKEPGGGGGRPVRSDAEMACGDG